MQYTRDPAAGATLPWAPRAGSGPCAQGIRARIRTPPAPMRLLALSLLTSLVAAAPASAPGPRDPVSRALIIAISDYGTPPADPRTQVARTAYRTLNAKNDVPLVRGALMEHGFAEADIRVLADSAATREGILAEFEQLVRESGPGDVVVVHYSGHGHQIADDDGDEMDGYD